MTFLTNGSWSAREQLRNPACIQFLAYNPFPGSGVAETIGWMKVELILRVSDKIIPGFESTQPVKPTDGTVTSRLPEDLGARMSAPVTAPLYLA